MDTEFKDVIIEDYDKDGNKLVIIYNYQKSPIPNFDFIRYEIRYDKNNSVDTIFNSLFNKEDISHYIFTEEEINKINSTNRARYEEMVAKEQARKQQQVEYEDLDGFGDDLTPMQLGRIRKVLNAQKVSSGHCYNTKRFLKKVYNEGFTELNITEFRNDNGKLTRRRELLNPKNQCFYELKKIEYDYVEYLKDKRILT